MEKRNDSHVFTVELLGQDMARESNTTGRLIARYDHFETLKDALLQLLSMDVAHFDEYYSAETTSKLYFEQARIVYGPQQSPILDLYRVHFSDSLDGIPPPGLYLRLQEQPKVIEEASGIPLRELNLEDEGVPFIMLARIRFDQVYEVIAAPALLRFQEQLRTGRIDALYGPADWQYKVYARSDHYHDDGAAPVTKSTGGHPSNRLTAERFYYLDLREAFNKMLLLDHYAMAPAISAAMGLGRHIETLLLSDAGNQPIVSVHFIHEIKAENRLAENGLYLSFHTPLETFENKTQLDLSGLPLYPQQNIYHQIMALTADGQRLVCKDSFRPILEQAGRSSPQNMALVNRYLEQVPFLLRIEWERMPPSASDEHIVPPTEVRPFVSQYQALVALKDVSDDLFYPDRPTVVRQGIFIKHAGVYDGRDGKPIWTKFLSETDDPNLPQGVMTRLHDQKISFETLPMTLQLFSHMVGKESLQFMVCKPPSTSANATQKNTRIEHKEDKQHGKGPAM